MRPRLMRACASSSAKTVEGLTIGFDSQQSRVCFGDHFMDRLHFVDKLPEHVRQQRLWAVRQCVFGMIVNFNHNSVRARSDRRAPKRNDLVALAGSMRGIDDDRKMRAMLDRGND